jgi:type IV pilus biogenesis protein CpaD/CtpE
MPLEYKKMLVAAVLAASVATVGMTGPAAADPAQNGDKHRDWQEKQPRLMPSELIDARIAFLKTALKITDAQSDAWNAFAGVLRKQAKQRDEEIQAWRASENNAPRDAITALERRQQKLARAAANVSEMLSAAKPLYASLSDDQKKRADVLLGRGEGRGGRRL